LLKKAGAEVKIVDYRHITNKTVSCSFTGELKGMQKNGLSALLDMESGVLVAPPGAGKTVIACALIAARKLPTLILVHRKQLAEQWKNQLSKFLSVEKGIVGNFCSKREKRSSNIDIGLLQTFSKLMDRKRVFSDYGMVIIDECHHVPAASFEQALKNISARHIVGLTATPYRKDGLQAIIHMYCGPTAYTMGETDGQVDLLKKVILRETVLRLPGDGVVPAIYEIWSILVKDQARTNLIVGDIVSTLKQKQFPLILSDRKDHLEYLFEQINQRCREGIYTKGFILTSEVGKRTRREILSDIKGMIENGEVPYLLSTGSLIGEGFDLPELSALFLTMPISFKGRLVQYAGRLHRESKGKNEVRIFDYVDVNIGLGISMFRKRLATYRKMGYSIEVDSGSKLFDIVNYRKQRI
jgi:superfamily II DNA or RNA helicase